jgi:mono/diheme cytochrome c family protein
MTALTTGDGGMVLSRYTQLTVAYAGVSKEIAELYPIRCQRLLRDRIQADTAIVRPRIDGASATLALTALRSGLASIGSDIDQRIRQASPNGLVGSQDEATPDAPAATGTPTWNSPDTQLLATRACSACHSNSPGWAWYSNLAPLSWLVQHDIDAGRAAMNLSEWDLPQTNAVKASAAVLRGSMPPAWAAAIDPELHLTDTERGEVVRGLAATFR